MEWGRKSRRLGSTRLVLTRLVLLKVDSTYWKSSGESSQESLGKCHLSARVYRTSKISGHVLYHAWVRMHAELLAIDVH